MAFLPWTTLIAQPSQSGIDKVYEQFSEAYNKLDTMMVEALYTPEAYYLSPNADKGIRVGSEEIMQGFRSTFKNARDRGSQLRISFKIIKREISGDMAYDVGYYKFESIPEERDPYVSAGKFVTVLKYTDTDRWQFVVDGYSAAPVTAFDEAVVITK